MIPRIAWYGVAGAAAIAFVVLVYNEGKQAQEAANKQVTYEQLKERMRTNETVKGFTDAQLCAAIGGKLRGDKCE